MKSTRHPRRLPLILEIPLAVLSWLFYRLMRSLVRPLIVMNSRRGTAIDRQWNYLTEDKLDRKIVLPGIMTTGPRWNTHAILAAAGPFDVRHSMSFDTQAALNSAESWTIVVYSFPDQRTVAYLGSQQAPFADRWVERELPEGRYSLALRYYRWIDKPMLPEVRGDGAMLAPELPVTTDINALYTGLRNRRGRFYLWLHYYVFTMLRLRGRLSERFVQHELLPMGNPETQFRYGFLYQGERLCVQAAPDLWVDFDIYVTIYTRDSFPSTWGQITQSEFKFQPVQEDSFYLVRLQSRKAGTPALLNDRLTLSSSASDQE